MLADRLATVERFVDKLAARFGLCCKSIDARFQDQSASLVYRDGIQYQASIDIAFRGWAGGQRLWVLSGVASRLDIGLSVEVAQGVRGETFEKKLAESFVELRRTPVYPGQRLKGRLVEWDQRKQQGFVHCFRGARVYLNLAELRRSGIGPEMGRWLIFRIRRTRKGPEAEAVQYVAAVEQHT